MPLGAACDGAFALCLGADDFFLPLVPGFTDGFFLDGDGDVEGFFGVRLSRQLPSWHFQLSMVLAGSVPFLQGFWPLAPATEADAAGAPRNSSARAPADTVVAEPSRLKRRCWGISLLLPAMNLLTSRQRSSCLTGSQP
ncbi:hypothetical protein ACFQHO_42825 [Actinomadura yumaensis]|uniref:hypothetical protein n=1 Tax=Actinomadura TaxID=1988 RepID=UPI0013298276|nr:hypothetical protein [Actinomadura sp. J1-007]MWK39266.1 hypothetical protein [Actinomadura sp. J1-007]